MEGWATPVEVTNVADPELCHEQKLATLKAEFEEFQAYCFFGVGQDIANAMGWTGRLAKMEAEIKFLEATRGWDHVIA
jgi:hypothetical protein